MVGTGLGANRGVLFKNAMALEAAAHIDVVIMDKTGTLTKGEPEVTDVVAEGIDEGRLLALVAAVERESRSEEHTSELQSLMRISYAVFCLKKKTKPLYA